MLFNKKHQKRLQVIWGILSILIILSMILLYSPIFKLKQAPTPAPALQ